MHQRLPSLNSLRAFEAAARHLSLSKAARELNVTPAAISHQVKALEADLQVKLLGREKGEFFLTQAAQAALPALSAGFGRLVEAVRRMRADRTVHFLTISVGTTFASNWLVRRLASFKEAFPEIDVRLQTTDTLADFTHDGVDVAIRFGGGDYPGLESIRILADEVFPVCSPRLLERGPPLETPADLANHTLLHVVWTLHMGETYDWEMWLRAAGVETLDFTRGPRFTHGNIALLAAVQGQGLTLSSNSMAGDELAAGTLIRPFDINLPTQFTHFLVYPEGAAEVPKIAAFRAWILAEIGNSGNPGAEL